MIIHSITNRLFTSLFFIISICVILTFSACAGDKTEQGTDAPKFNPVEITHLKEEMLNGQVQSLVKQSYGPVVKTQNGWIKGNVVTKRTSMFGENGNMDLTTEEYYGDAERLIGKRLTMYQYDNNKKFTGSSITSLSGDIITQTVEWNDNSRTITSFKGEDVSDLNKIIQVEVSSFNSDGSVSAKVTDDGSDGIILYGYDYNSDNTIITVQNKASNSESRLYRTVLEKDKHNNPLVVVISKQPFDGIIADSYEEYEYTYWDE